MNGIEQLIVNLLFILFTSFIFQHLQYRKDFSDKPNIKYLLILGMIQVTFSMWFAVEYSEGFQFDLRFITLIFLGLYGGPRVAIPLGIFIIGMRFLFGEGDGVFYNASVAVIQAAIIIGISKNFLTRRLHHKLLFGLLLSILFSGLMFLLPIIYQTTQISLRFMVFYTAISTLGVIVSIYTAELFHANKFLEAEMIKTEKISAVSHLAASFSHEIRNPLTSTRGFLQLLQDKNLSDETRDVYINIAIKELDHAKAIIDDYLTFAKPHSVDIKPLNISAELRKVMEIMGPLAHKQGVEFEEDLTLSFLTYGDQQKFRQCIVNIVKNGIEALPSGGKIYIKTGEDHSGFFVEIIDNGVGMTKEQLSRLGEPYFSTKGIKGTGLGMMVVFRILESMKASIDISSELGQGTKILIHFKKSARFAS